MKKIIISIIFVCIFLSVYFHWERVIQIKRNIEYGNFFHNEKADIVFIGTSMTYHAFSPMYIWNKYGIVSYNRGSSGQSYKMSYYLMKDAVEKHDAKVIVFDINYLLQAKNLYSSNINDIVNMIPLYKRYNAYKEIFGKDFSIEQINISARFHNRWKELTMYDFRSFEYWKGFIGKYMYPFRTYTGNIQIKNHEVQLFDETIKYAKLFQEYAKNKGITLIFIKIPAINLDHGFATAFEELSFKNNYIFFNYEKLIDQINYCYKKDLADTHHTNFEGGKKILDHLIPNIMKMSNIPNRKNEPSYSSWNEDYKKYIRQINKQIIRNIKSFADWKKQAFYDNYTVLLSTNGDVLRKLPDTLKNDLKSFGLKKYNTDKPNMRYAAIIDDNKVFFEEVSNKPVTYKGRMKNIVNLLVKSDGKAIINVSGKPRSKNKYGLNFVIYDKVNREIVDSIWIDPRKPDVARR